MVMTTTLMTTLLTTTVALKEVRRAMYVSLFPYVSFVIKGNKRTRWVYLAAQIQRWQIFQSQIKSTATASLNANAILIIHPKDWELPFVRAIPSMTPLPTKNAGFWLLCMCSRSKPSTSRAYRSINLTVSPDTIDASHSPQYLTATSLKPGIFKRNVCIFWNSWTGNCTRNCCIQHNRVRWQNADIDRRIQYDAQDYCHFCFWLSPVVAVVPNEALPVFHPWNFYVVQGRCLPRHRSLIP